MQPSYFSVLTVAGDAAETALDTKTRVISFRLAVRGTTVVALYALIVLVNRRSRKLQRTSGTRRQGCAAQTAGKMRAQQARARKAPWL